MSDVEETAVIGISFGNTTSAISYTNREGKAECIANEEGNRSIPSALSYVGGDEYHGDQAYAQLIRNPRHTVTCFRDFLGKKFADIDPSICQHAAHPIEHDGKVAFKVPIAQSPEDENPVDKVFTVEEITTRHLAKLRDSAQDFLGKQVSGAVVTVPTDFTQAQRKVLEDAAQAAGLQVLQIIHEPVASALAYAALDAARGELPPASKNIVVCDVGANRTDVTVVAARSGLYTILSTVHDYELGGKQLDDVLVDWFSKEFTKKTKVDIVGNVRATAKMSAQCETTKKTLSASQSATVSVESVAEGLDFHSSINRIRYEMLARKVISQVCDVIEKAVGKASLETLDIDEVILAGGSSHTPKLAQSVAYLFPESTHVRAAATTTSTPLNPSELACLGAAVQASLVADIDREDIVENTQAVITSIPHLAAPLGVKAADGTFVTVLDAHTPLPSRRSVDVEVSGGAVEVYEGKPEIEVTELPKPERDPEDSEDDDDEEDEPQTEKKRVIRPATKLTEVKVSATKVSVTIQVDADSKVTVQVRSA
ncbi:Hsp70 protein that interacts with Zuo1p [Savitreella phatthalungensis]